MIDAGSGETLSQTYIGSAFTNDAFFLAGNADSDEDDHPFRRKTTTWSERSDG